MAKVSARLVRTRWSVEQARAILAQVAESGMSIQRFAEQEGLIAERLYRWARKLRDGERPQFVEVATATVSRPAVEVLLRNGLTVRVSESSDVEFVAHLVGALEQLRVC
jgi:transposase-like protein